MISIDKNATTYTHIHIKFDSHTCGYSHTICVKTVNCCEWVGGWPRQWKNGSTHSIKLWMDKLQTWISNQKHICIFALEIYNFKLTFAICPFAVLSVHWMNGCRHKSILPSSGAWRNQILPSCMTEQKYFNCHHRHSHRHNSDSIKSFPANQNRMIFYLHPGNNQHKKKLPKKI